MSWSIMGQFVATVILLEAAPTAFAKIGYKFWILLICLTFIYGVLVYLFLPEVCVTQCNLRFAHVRANEVSRLRA